MGLWIFFPISLSLVSFIGTWTVYGLAFANNHVCSLSDWGSDNYCKGNQSTGCCLVPTISSSGTSAPENSLFTATINAGAFLFLLFCIFHHAHILERHACHSMLSRIALVFGMVAAMGAFAAGNCNPGYLALLHYFGAAVSFTCICFYTVLLTALTRKCVLSGHEKILYPLRITSTVLQTIVTICSALQRWYVPPYAIFGPSLLLCLPSGTGHSSHNNRSDSILFTQDEYYYVHLSAVFEWILSVNLELFELSFAVEFYFFSSFMLSNLLSKREEEKPLMLSMS